MALMSGAVFSGVVEGDVKAELKRKPAGAGRSGAQTLPVEEAPEEEAESLPLEIRAATRPELEQVVAVRGRAFNISRSQWTSPDEISDAELDRIRVVLVDGKVVSCLTIIP